MAKYSDAQQSPDSMDEKGGTTMRTRKLKLKHGRYGSTIPKSRSGKHKRKKGKGRRY